MKKILVTILAVGMIALTSTAAIAAETTFVCPNGNPACVTNGACINDGQCQYNVGCANNGVPRQNGSGHHNGGQGRGHHGGGRHC